MPNFRRASLLLFAMIFLLMMLVGCLNHPPRRVVIDNQGLVCLYANSTNTFGISIASGNIACLSSSCTEIHSKTGDIQINSHQFEIKLTAHFDAEEQTYGRGCTTDCAGAGRIQINDVTLADGEYRIWLGDNYLGMFVVPAMQNKSICFETSKTPTPTRTPFTPTATPTNTPTPPTFLSPLVTPISPLPTPTSDL